MIIGWLYSWTFDQFLPYILVMCQCLNPCKISSNSLSDIISTCFLCLSLLLPKVVHCRMRMERLLALMLYPYHFNFLFLIVVMRLSNGPVSCLMVSCTASFVDKNKRCLLFKLWEESLTHPTLFWHSNLFFVHLVFLAKCFNQFSL